MEDNREILKSKALLDREIGRDLLEIRIHRDKFIKEMKNGLGDDINDIRSYIKPEPTFFQKLKTKIKRIMRAI